MSVWCTCSFYAGMSLQLNLGRGINDQACHHPPVNSTTHNTAAMPAEQPETSDTYAANPSSLIDHMACVFTASTGNNPASAQEGSTAPPDTEISPLTAAVQYVLSKASPVVSETGKISTDGTLEALSGVLGGYNTVRRTPRPVGFCFGLAGTRRLNATELAQPGCEKLQRWTSLNLRFPETYLLSEASCSLGVIGEGEKEVDERATIFQVTNPTALAEAILVRGDTKGELNPGTEDYELQAGEWQELKEWDLESHEVTYHDKNLAEVDRSMMKLKASLNGSVQVSVGTGTTQGGSDVA